MFCDCLLALFIHSDTTHACHDAAFMHERRVIELHCFSALQWLFNDSTDPIVCICPLVDSTSLDSIRFDSIRFDSIRFDSIRFDSLDSTRLDSTRSLVTRRCD